MISAENVLAVARGELGTVESPANSNRVKYNSWFWGREVSGNAYPWCMAFVQWCFAQAGGPELLPARTASCGALMRAAKESGSWVTRGFLPGDVVIYDFSGKKMSTEHTGILESVTASGVTAIEGNTSQAGSQSNGGQVCRKIRTNAVIIGAVRPEYKEDIMDFAKWTDADFIRFASKMQAALSKQTVSAALAPELEEAKARGITDGSSPCAFATRAQTAVMTLRAVR